MSERYSKLFALSENLYSAGAPVVIAAGALQKDNQTGKVFAQLKIRNIQDKMIKAATVKITPFDTAGKPLGGTMDYQYLDLSAGRDSDFGQKTPVMLKEAATRAFSVSVTEIIYSDNSTWTDHGEVWEPLSAPMIPEKAFEDGELAKQYRVKYGADCKCIFKKEKDLWRCACGALNHDSEKNCHSCQREAATLAALNVDELKAERNKRVATEQKQAAEKKAAAAEQAKKAKKIAMIATPIAVVVIIAAVLISNFMKAQQEEAARLDAYNTAVAFVGAGEYDKAIAAFAEMGDYKDSEEWANIGVAYEKVLFLLDCAERGDETGLKVSTQTKPKAETTSSAGNSAGDSPASSTPAEQEIPDTVKAKCAQKAIIILTAIGDYRDSQTLLTKANALLQEEIGAKNEAEYETALKYLNEGDSYSACEAFERLGDYKDSIEKLNEAILQNNIDCFGYDNTSAQFSFAKDQNHFQQINGDEIQQRFVGTWIMKSWYYKPSYYTEQTHNADGSGQSTADENLIRWAVSENHLQYVRYKESYAVATDGQLMDERLNKDSYTVLECADGVWAAYEESKRVPNLLFIDPNSVWAQRLIKAYQ